MNHRRYIPLAINDILARPGVQAFDDQQFAWYFRLICQLCLAREPLAHLLNDDVALQEAAGVTLQTLTAWQEKRLRVLSKFKLTEDGKYFFDPEIILEFSRAAKKSPTKAATDPRHNAVRLFIERCCAHAGVPFVWEPAEAKQLSSFLRGAPGLSTEAVIELVKARFRSQEPPGNRPRIWIANLGRYAQNSKQPKKGAYVEANEQLK